MKSRLIISDTAILGGKPVITGTRIPISRVLFLLKEGYTIDALHAEYPHVQKDTFSQVMTELMHNVDAGRYAA